jgi:hypothetical protein
MKSDLSHASLKNSLLSKLISLLFSVVEALSIIFSQLTEIL